MVNMKDFEQEKLWDSIQTLARIDTEQAEAVFKATVERFLRHIDSFTSSFYLFPFKLPSTDCIQTLKELEKKIIEKLNEKEEDEAYEHLVDYIDELSDLSETDPKLIRKKFLASILVNHRNNESDSYVQENITNHGGYTIREGSATYYTPNEVAKRLGVSDQTVRRMCDKGKFSGAYQTDGGHWKIPEDALHASEVGSYT